MALVAIQNEWKGIHKHYTARKSEETWEIMDFIKCGSNHK